MNSPWQETELYLTVKARKARAHLESSLHDAVYSLRYSVLSLGPKMFSLSTPHTDQTEIKSAMGIVHQEPLNQSIDLKLSLDPDVEERDANENDSLSPIASLAEDMLFAKFGLNPKSNTLRRARNSRETKWENGVNFSQQVTGPTIEFDAISNDIGSLSIRIGSATVHGPGYKYFFVIRVCSSKFKSPTIFPDANNILKWEITATFKVNTIHSDARVLLFKSHLVSDSLVGQVVIPISTFLSHGNTGKYTTAIKGIYEPYPLPLSGKYFQAETLTKPKISLGTVEVDCLMKFKPTFSLLKQYLFIHPKSYRKRKDVSLSPNIPKDIRRYYLKILRHIYRLRRVIGILLKPVYGLINLVKTFIFMESPMLYWLVVAGIYAKQFNFIPCDPTNGNLYTIMLVLFFTKRILTRYFSSPIAVPTVWKTNISSEQVDQANQMQMLTYMSSEVSRIESRLDSFVSAIEKAILLFSWEDKVITTISILMLTIFLVNVRLVYLFVSTMPQARLIFLVVHVPMFVKLYKILSANISGSLVEHLFGQTFTSFKKYLLMRLWSLWIAVPTLESIEHKRLCNFQRVA